MSPNQPINYLKLYALLRKTTEADLYLAIGRWIDHGSLQKALTDRIVQDMVGSDYTIPGLAEALRRILWNRAYVYGVIGSDYVNKYLFSLSGRSEVAILDFVLDRLAGESVQWKGIFQENIFQEKPHAFPMSASQEALLLSVAPRILHLIYHSGNAQLLTATDSACSLLGVPILNNKGFHLECIQRLIKLLDEKGGGSDQWFILTKDWSFELITPANFLAMCLQKGDILLLAFSGELPNQILDAIRRLEL